MLEGTLAVPACAVCLVLTCLAPLPAQAADEGYTLGGHLDLSSRYYVRGITTTYGNVKPGLGNKGADAPESDMLTPQWGLDFTHPSGFYLGYWASTVNFSYKQVGRSYDQYARSGVVSVSDYQQDKSVENDIYGGYTGKLGDWAYTLGLIGYLYINGGHSNGTESRVGLAWQSFSANAQTLLNDTVWGNRGDTYWTLNYSRPLPADLSLSVSLGGYSYTRDGRYLGTRDAATGGGCPAGAAFVVNGCYAGKTPVDRAFRHLILGLSRPIGQTGFNWTVQGIVGGDNRFGVNQASRLVGLLSYGF
ncbi:TorF family putative porin [Zoogloea sp.]|uniref:TorF family putative porin n=1 Tax=Zoogloea sp. TaxID=49181 RepID=UPI001415BA6B|nr:MAG: hypothetical protein F9K15_04150 [Zoogloea sp.]